MALLWRRVWADVGVGECRIACLGLVLADEPGDPAAAELVLALVEEQWMIFAAGPVESVFGEVGAQERHRVVGERDVAGLSAFAGQGDQRGRGEADVTDGEVGEFADPGPGVVEDGEQGRVAAALPGGAVWLGEQTAGLLDGQVVDRRLGCPLHGDGEDVLAAGHPGGVLGLHPPVERADRGQALIAGRGAVVPAGLEPVQESGDGVGVDVIEGELVRRDGSLVAEEDDQELEGVPVGRDGVG